MLENIDIYAVIPAAGVGKRMACDRPKQYLKLLDKTVLHHTVQTINQLAIVEGVVVAISSGDEYFATCGVSSMPNVTRVDGGKERVDSVLSGLEYWVKSAGPAKAAKAWVLVHDAARPNVKPDEVNRLVQQCIDKQCGGILAAPVRDTMKRSHIQSDLVAHTECRESLWHALTPQFFPLLALRDALRQGLAAGLTITDEASAMEQANHQVLLVEGGADNLKITRPEDLALAEFYLMNKGKIND